MFVNSLNSFIGINNVAKKENKPTFKRQNYARVFKEEYARTLYTKNSVDIMFRRLLGAVKYPKTIATGFFINEFSQKELDGNLLRLLRPGHDDSYDRVLAASKKGYPILETEDGMPLITIYNNGRYRSETFIDRLRKGERVNANIIFNGVDEDADKTITFGADFYSDVFAARGTNDKPALRKEMFYLENGKIKEKLEYSPESDSYISSEYYLDGSRKKWTIIDTVGELVTDAINGLTGNLFTKP